MSEPMGLREFGRLVGLSGEGVRKAIKAGRIPAAAMGTVTLRTGKTRPAIVDVDLARRSLGDNTNQALQRDQQVLSERRAAVARKAPQPPPADDPPAGDRGDRKGPPTQAESNAITAAYKARMAKLEYEQAIGKLVDAAEVEKRMTTMIRDAVAKLRGVPTNAKMAMPHLTVRDVEQLENMIDAALEELANYGS